MVTEVGFAVGTPAYMSPEQASGQAELGAASDVYSLACVVYENLAGEPPFRVRRARRDGEAVTESPRPLRGFRPEVPVATERRLSPLEKDPRQRYASAAESSPRWSLPRDRRDTHACHDAVHRRAPLVNASPDPRTST